MNQLYMAWTAFQRRQVSMAPHCGFDLIFMPVERSAGKLRKLLIYLTNAFKTLQVLGDRRPDVVWFQLPQVPLLWVALFYRRFFNRRAVLIADCHNKMFRPPWSKFPLGISLLSHCDLVLVHNEDVYSDAVGLGIRRDKAMVVEDPPAVFDHAVSTPLNFKFPRPIFVFPASFAEDEPIRELLDAAVRVPNISFVITGNVKNCHDMTLIQNAPKNVHFVGFLSREEFDALIVSCDAVIALTLLDGIQLSVCGEAVGAAKPMLISDTPTLRRLFPNGNIFVNSDCKSIAEGASRLLNSLSELSLVAKNESCLAAKAWLEMRGTRLMDLVDAKTSL